MPESGEELSKLILGTKDDETRALLLVLQKLTMVVDDMVRKLAEHEKDFLEHRSKFEQHAVEEMQLINRGIGLWRAIAFVGPIFVSVVGTLGFYNLGNTVNELAKEIKINEMQQGELNSMRTEIASDRMRLSEHIRNTEFALTRLLNNSNGNGNR